MTQRLDNIRTANRALRDAVINQIAKVIYDAERVGADGWKAAETAFPGTPIDVIAVASSRAGEQHSEEWWQLVEDTIDGEVVRNPLTLVSNLNPRGAA